VVHAGAFLRREIDHFLFANSPSANKGDSAVSNNGHVIGKSRKSVPAWKIIGRQKNLLLVQVAGKLVRISGQRLRLKGKPRYHVPPDCDPTMW
jgi:hypothetical protein